MSHYDGTDPRVRVHYVEGRRVHVVVPPEYDSNDRTYPVVFLFPGGFNSPEAFLVEMDLLGFTAGLPDPEQAIVVLPYGGVLNVWFDWRDGTRMDSTYFVETLLPWVEEAYRVAPGPSTRAIGGFSGGGGGALSLSARHPDLFASVASLSGFVSWTAIASAFSTALGIGTFLCDIDGGLTIEGPLGAPITDEVWAHDVNPSDLAPNYGGLSVSLFSGNGVPCEPADLRPNIPTWPASYGETALRYMNDDLSAALDAAGVEHGTTRYACGVHQYWLVEQELREWWPTMIDAFGRPSPSSFDHRRAQPTFSVYGWTLTADPIRAAEFLDVVDASPTGVTLTGSGIASVTTAEYFTPGQAISLTGAVEPTATADPTGRIFFHVDLGPAHSTQQYTPVATLLEAAGGYWRTRAVTFGSPS